MKQSLMDERRQSGQEWRKTLQSLGKKIPASDQTFTATGKDMHRVLKKRAAALAKEIMKDESSGEFIEGLEFDLAAERYVFESSCVREVCPLHDLSLLPRAPACVIGLMNIRGQILVVMDIRKLFRLPKKGLTQLNKVIVISVEGLEAGIVADEIQCIRKIPLQYLQPPPPSFTGIHGKYLRGITQEGAAIINVAALLVDEWGPDEK